MVHYSAATFARYYVIIQQIIYQLDLGLFGNHLLNIVFFNMF